MTSILINVAENGAIEVTAGVDTNAFTYILREVTHGNKPHGDYVLLKSLLAEMSMSPTPSVVLNKYLATAGLAAIIKQLFVSFVEYVEQLMNRDGVESPNYDHVILAMRKYGVRGNKKAANALLRSVVFKDLRERS